MRRKRRKLRKAVRKRRMMEAEMEGKEQRRNGAYIIKKLNRGCFILYFFPF